MKNKKEPRFLSLHQGTNFLRELCLPTCYSAVKQDAVLFCTCTLAELEPAGPSPAAPRLPAAPLALPRRPRQQDVRWCQVTSRLSAAGSPQPQRLGKGSPSQRACAGHCRAPPRCSETPRSSACHTQRCSPFAPPRTFTL